MDTQIIHIVDWGSLPHDVPPGKRRPLVPVPGMPGKRRPFVPMPWKSPGRSEWGKYQRDRDRVISGFG